MCQAANLTETKKLAFPDTNISALHLDFVVTEVWRII